MKPSSKSKTFAECRQISDLATPALTSKSVYNQSTTNFHMDNRIEFKDDNTRIHFFKEVKQVSGLRTWKELAIKLGRPRKSFQKYQLGLVLTPQKLFQKMLAYLPDARKEFYLINTIKKNGNWGCIKGGQKSIKIIYSKYPKEITKKWRQKGGRNGACKINEIKRNLPEKERYLFLRKTKLMKSVAQLVENEKRHIEYFKPREIAFDLSQINVSKNDIKRNIILPNKLTPELAEEIGIHLGDGTLSKKKYYFSVRGGLLEEDYYTNFVLPLYKKLYNINPPLLKRSQACGFEISSKGIREFKNKVLGIIIGTKTYKVEVPNCIIESKDKEIYCAFLRGLIDTDGCYYYSETKQYPVISLTLKSIHLLKKVNEILNLLGYNPCLFEKSFQIHINGFPQFKKWTDEIGSSSPKNQKRIANIKNKLPWSRLDKILACGASDSGSNPGGGM
jgi:hypothetical protein